MSRERLVDNLWNGAPPKSSATTLQTFVWQLRRRGIECLRTTPSGDYYLDVAPDEVDVRRFERMVEDARDVAVAAPGEAAESLRAALGLWRGGAYEEFASEPWATVEVARLEQRRIEAVELWAAAAIGAGATAGLPAELEVWTGRAPLRERLWALRVIALARQGRNAEALRVANELRQVLRDELGVGPSAPFLAVETTILRGEPLPAWPELGGFGFPPPAPAGSPGVPKSPGAPKRRRRRPANRPTAASNTRMRDHFVGRAAELELLDDALDDARSGLPRVVCIVGEAGIGKSRLLEEFTRAAGAGPARILRGTCHAGAAYPYEPLATATFALFPRNESPFDPGRPRAVDETDPARAADLDSEARRLRLFFATTSAILDAADAQTTVLVVEDIHWGSEATLALLGHLVAVAHSDAANRRSRLLIVLTSRPPEPSTQVRSFIARLRRDHLTAMLDLAPLDLRACAELIREWTGATPSRATVDHLVEATAGNALLLRCKLQRLRDRGGVIDESAFADILVATDLDDELEQRLDRVGDACHEMLCTAAVLGDGSTLTLLAATCDLDEAALDELIDEAASQQVLEADDERYWFDHPQLRELLAGRLTSRERAARHLQIAERLRQRGEDTVVVAYHFVRAGQLADPRSLAEVCGEAADRSATVGAWRDAARYASSALTGAKVLGLDEEELAALEYRAGRAAFLAGDREVGRACLEAAAERARSAGATLTWGHALVTLARERVESTDLAGAIETSLHELAEFLAATGDREPALRAEAHALQAELHTAVGDLAAADRHARTAETLASDIDDAELQVKVAFSRGLQELASVDLVAARHAFQRVLPVAATLANPHPRVWFLSRLGMLAYVTGDLDEANGLLDAALDAGRATGNLGEYSMTAAMAASAAFAQERFATVEGYAERALGALREVDNPFTPTLLFPTLAAARSARGDHRGAQRALDEWDRLQPRRSRRFRPLLDVLAGDTDAALRAVEDAGFRFVGGRRAPDLFMAGTIAAEVDLAALLGAPPLTREPVETLIDLHNRGVRLTLGWPARLSRTISLGLRAVGDARGADEWASCARREARAVSVEPATTITPRAAPAGARAESTRVILVTDLVSSTSLNERLGDRDYLQHLRRHDRVIRERLAQHDGVEFKHTGDGIAAWFFSVNRALRCATELVHDFSDEGGATPLRVKIAIAAGEPTIVDETDLRGIAVVEAFRVLDLARSGEVLVTSDVAGLAHGLGWVFEHHGRHALKGLREPVEVLHARPAQPAVVS